MTPARWQQVKRLFDAALARDDAGERAAFVAAACAGDAELAAEVDSLLASHELELPLVEGDFVDVCGRLLAHGLDEARTGLRLGNYRILHEIGRGGMAAVYAAVRADQEFDQRVAVKLIRRGMDTELMVARFRQERQILAHLDHPNIARLFDGGVTGDGLPYLVMEEIDGEPIDAFCDRRCLPLGERLALFRTVCAAVQYAHRNLVVHRDLKPSNILVTADGVPKLLDFGIAKLLEPDDQPRELELTADGPRPMTPEYASPEQVLGRPVTTASDVYALGVLLYRLLTGRRPYRLERISRREVERVIAEEEPERPSAAVERGAGEGRESASPGELGRRRGTTAAELRRKLRGDLDNIVSMAMRKEPERRYGSAQQLADDVSRYLDGLPVVAHESTIAYRASKFVRRHRLGVAAALLVFLSLVAAVAVSTRQMRLAQRERLTAESVSGFLVDLFELSDPEKARGKEIPARTLLDRSVGELDRLADQPEVRATLMDTIGRVYLNLGMLDEAGKLLGDALEIRRRILAADDPAIADSQANLGALLVDSAHYDRAERLHRAALELRRRRLPEDDERIAESENDLGKVLELRGRLDEAETLLTAALARQRRALGDDNEVVAKTLNLLALVLADKGRLHEAAALYRRSLDLDRRLLGDDHPEVAIRLNNLALVLCDLGEREPARALLEEAEALEEKVLREEHWSLAATRNNLATCLRTAGDLEGAEELYRSSLEQRRAALGPDHPHVAESLNNLGRLLFDRGETGEAERLFREALAIYRRLPGGTYPDAVGTINNLASVLLRRGELAEAEELFREALDKNHERYGGEHERIARNLNNLGETLRRQGRLEEAKASFSEALAMFRRFLGDEHLEVAAVHLSLAHVLFARQRMDEAAAEYGAAFAVRRSLLGADHRDVAVAASGLGRALVAAGRPGEAEPRLRQALAIFRQLPPPSQQPHVAIAETALGRCLAALGSHGEARRLLEESHAYLRQRFGTDHKWTREARLGLDELAAQRPP